MALSNAEGEREEREDGGGEEFRKCGHIFVMLYTFFERIFKTR